MTLAVGDCYFSDGKIVQSDGYRWSGPTAGKVGGGGGQDVDVAGVLARAAELRLTGRLLLQSYSGTTTVELIGGEPLSGTPAGGFSTFELVQAMPDLSGSLTDGVELSGALSERRPRDLIRHCEDLRLSVDLFVSRGSGEHAQVRFAHGRVESAEVNGVPELGALGKLERWTEGTFRLVLRPLFSSSAPVAPPLGSRTAPPQGASFDFTGGTPLAPLRDGDHGSGGLDSGGLDSDALDTDDPTATARMAPLAPPRPTSAADGTPLYDDSPSGQESTALTNPLAPPRARPTPPMGQRLSSDAQAAALDHDPDGTMQVRRADPDALDDEDFDPDGTSQRPRVSLRRPLRVLGIALGLAFAVGATWVLLRKPGPAEVPLKVESAELPTPPAPPPPSKVEPSPSTSSAPGSAVPRDPEAARLVARGRRLLVAGHPHTALDAFKAALHRQPGDASVDRYQRMAAGKTGHGELLVTGTGAVTICGESVRAGKRLKLPAGPYTVEKSGGLEEIEVPRKGKVTVSSP